MTTKQIRLSSDALAILQKIRTELGREDNPASYSRAVRYLARQAKSSKSSQ